MIFKNDEEDKARLLPNLCMRFKYLKRMEMAKRIKAFNSLYEIQDQIKVIFDRVADFQFSI